MNRRFLSLLIALILVFALAIPAFADEDITAPNGYSYSYFVPKYDSLLNDPDVHRYENVWDFAFVLSDDEEAKLQERAEADKSERGVNTYFLTYDDACGTNESTFSDDFYDYYITKLDFDHEVDGVLYVVDFDNRQLYIDPSGSYSGKLTESEAYELLDGTCDKATSGDYYGFFTSTDDVTLKKLFPTVKEKIIPSTTSLIVSTIVAALVVIILLVNHNKANKAPLAQTYQKAFNVKNRNAVFMGHREEVIHDFYKQESSSGGGGHSSGGGGSHGGGGHGF